MNSTSTRQALLGILVILVLGVAGCGSGEAKGAASDTAGEETTAAESATTVTRISGYPLDRSLSALVTTPDVDTIVVVKATKFGVSQFVGSTGPDGAPSANEFIVTPIDATVDFVHRGTVKAKEPIRLIIGGGKVGDVEFLAGPEIAAQRKDLIQYSRLLVAGKTITVDGLGQVLDPYFVYGVNGEGGVKSLMESAGGGEVYFSLDALQAKLGS